VGSGRCYASARRPLSRFTEEKKKRREKAVRIAGQYGNRTSEINWQKLYKETNFVGW
jgi:hypothetical protein